MDRRKTTQHMGVGSYKEPVLIEEVIENVKALLKALKYQAKKNKWRYNIIVVVSEHDRYIHEKVKVIDGVGRPTTEFRQVAKIKNSQNNEYIVKPHIHILVKANPGATIVKFIKNYWEKRYGSIKFYTTKSSSKTSENGNYNYANFKDYAIPQATSIRKSNYGYVGNFI